MKRVLQIEDNPDDAALTELLLSRPPGVWQCEAVRTVQAGLERLRQGGIDVVLMDLGLPDAVGTSAVREIVAAAPGIPVVVMTGHADAAQVRSALEAGARRCIAKGALEAGDLDRLLLDALHP